LETDFQNKAYDVTTLDNLSQLYAKAVEYYDSIKDEITSYFIFKIQDILATKRSLKMLIEQNTRESATADTTPTSIGDNGANTENITEKAVTFSDAADNKKPIREEANLEEESEEARNVDGGLQTSNDKKEKKKNRASISKMKTQRQRFVNFFHQVEVQKQSEMQSMNAVLNEFSTVSDKNDIYVKKDMSNQKQKLRKRLEKRKVDVFMYQTMSTYNPNVDEPLENKENEMLFTSFLAELEERDRMLIGNETFKEGMSQTNSDTSFESKPLSEGKRTSRFKAEDMLKTCSRDEKGEIEQKKLSMSPLKNSSESSFNRSPERIELNMIPNYLGPKRLKVVQ